MIEAEFTGSEYIDMVRNNPSFKKNRKKFVAEWIVRRGRSEIFRPAEDSALKHFNRLHNR